MPRAVQGTRDMCCVCYPEGLATRTFPGYIFLIAMVGAVATCLTYGLYWVLNGDSISWSFAWLVQWIAYAGALCTTAVVLLGFWEWAYAYHSDVVDFHLNPFRKNREGDAEGPQE